MSALIIKARTTISNPKYGKLKSLDEGLRYFLDARNISLATGSAVSAWTGAGNGNVLERKFILPSGDHVAPTFVDMPRPSLRFNGASMLANSELSREQEAISYLIVAKLDSLPAAQPDGSDRIFTGDSNGGYQSVLASTGEIRMLSGVYGSTPIPTNTEWFIAIFVFDGVNSRFITSANNDNTVRENPVSTTSQGRVSIGGNINRLNLEGAAFKGNIAAFAQYDKALSSEDMMQLFSYYKNDFAI